MAKQMQVNGFYVTLAPKVVFVILDAVLVVIKVCFHWPHHLPYITQSLRHCSCLSFPVSFLSGYNQRKRYIYTVYVT